MKKFEYRTEQFCLKGGIVRRTSIKDRPDFHDSINNLGSEGWELVSCFPTTEMYGRSNNLLLIFKREIKE